MLIDVIKKFEQTIKKETLTCEVLYNQESNYSETVINSETLNMNVEVVR